MQRKTGFKQSPASSGTAEFGLSAVTHAPGSSIGCAACVALRVRGGTIVASSASGDPCHKGRPLATTSMRRSSATGISQPQATLASPGTMVAVVDCCRSKVLCYKLALAAKRQCRKVNGEPPLLSDILADSSQSPLVSRLAS